MASVTYHFRDCFRVINKEALHWFPGHMGRGLKQMQQKLKSVDCVIEVHDARIPLSGRNPDFKHTVCGLKPHILVLNKKDLTDMSYSSKVLARLKQEGTPDVLFTNCKDAKCNGVKKIIPRACELISSSNRYNRSETSEYSIMIVGVPNVGKSSLINTLRNRFLGKSSAAAVGAKAGITKSVQNIIKVSEEPKVYLIDTPGILTPSIRDVEAGLRLSLCASLQDHLVGEEIIADYLLFWLNKHRRFNYVELMGLQEPSDNIGTVLTQCALKLGKTLKVRNYDGQYIYKPDMTSAAAFFLKAFRKGDLGTIMLDEDLVLGTVS
ncbi:mitochondrial GTPase 1 [Schistocerca americana]|uniref:mitochondrial GTPase 1 n=1 Tax=Schistocerca americana TaxID=7009 RepID=UPI001F4FE2AA|nr:mitochondrial GTPase 1 [Schistocerca americana]XP_047100653.1 mitochondrial GTPase 1 [Schistocerca piceifrons]XP_049946056.1 mitochondrial GTPase 1 isoform X1 [Schistocerca serialis cubense]XP_049946057.1 mitochondrial GTPase 1 isoform X1 [Schistocerca serialis cubense]